MVRLLIVLLTVTLFIVAAPADLAAQTDDEPAAVAEDAAAEDDVAAEDGAETVEEDAAAEDEDADEASDEVADEEASQDPNADPTPGKAPAAKAKKAKPKHAINRRSGGYVSLLKVFLAWGLFLFWVGTTDWVSRDAQKVRLNFVRWNAIVFGTFIGTFILSWLIPYFWVGFVLLLIAYIAPLATYIILRNKSVDNNKRVLTPSHIRYWFAETVSKIGVKVDSEAVDKHEKGPPVKLTALGGADDRENNVRLLSARQAPGLTDMREIISDGLENRASSIMLDFAQQNVTVRFMVDGVWLGRDPIEREKGDPALEALKILCGLKPEDRQSRQKGTFATEFEYINYESSLVTQGTKTGERAVLQFVDPKIHIETLDELGMRPKMQEQLAEMMSLDKGFLLVATMPSGGLKTATDVVLNSSDRLLREFMAVEDEAKRYEPVENVPVTTYKGANGEGPESVLVKVFRMDPNVVVVRDLVNAETVNMLCQETAEERLIFSTMRAKDGAEALLRVLALGADRDEFAGAATGVLYQRLIRKLCPACKEAYQPPPKVLQQLGIPQGRVQALYRPPQEPEEVCAECGGIGYLGRTAIFELLIVGDTVRKVLKTSPKLDLLRKAAKKDGTLTLQEEGVLMVAKGDTSLPELMRVLKQ